MHRSSTVFVDAPIPTAAERHRLNELRERAEELAEKRAIEFIQELKEDKLVPHLSSIRRSKSSAVVPKIRP